MKKSWIIIGVVVIFLFIIYRFFAGSYNNMVQYNEDVKSVWAKVETQYQRRGDLIDNLVSVVKGYADFEKSTLTAVIEARSQGISREGEIIDLGIKHNIVAKSGAWYSYDGDRIGQGRDNARDFLVAHPAMAAEIDKKLRAALIVKVPDAEKPVAEAEALDEA